MIAEGARVRDMFSSSEGTVAIEQAISEYQAFEVARVLNASTWHQADHELMGLKQVLDMRRNDLDEPFRDQVAAFNFVGIPERVEELEASSVPNREARLISMLGCVVDSVRSKLSFAHSELAAASTVTQNIVQLRKASADVGPTLQRRGLIDPEASTQKLECRVVDHFTKLVREFELALNSQDVLAIASQRVVATVYCSEARACTRDTTRRATALSRSQDCSSVPSSKTSSLVQEVMPPKSY